MAKWLAKEFDWDNGRYTGNYYDIAEAGIVAKFVDSFYGDDNTGDGSSSTPYKTLGAAITTLNSTGADGSRIFMNGIFSETLPTQTYWYEFIGCGGGRNGRTIFYYNSAANTYFSITTKDHRIHNVRFLNYVTTLPFVPQIRDRTAFMVNCLCAYLYFQANHSGTTIAGRFYFCKFKESRFYNMLSPGIYILGDSNVFYDSAKNINAGAIYLVANNSTTNDNFITHNQGYGNILNINGQFINPTQNDFNVRISSPLLGSGLVDEITGIAANVGGVEVGLPYNGITPEFTTEGGATITDLTIDSTGKFTITAPATTGTLETALMDLGNIYPLENIDLFNVFDFLSGEITQGVFEDFVSPRMALTIKLKYGLTSTEVDDCPWLLIEYGKQPTYSGSGASRVGNADDTFDLDTFQTITCRYMKLFITLQNNS